jgi:hypothetical protein
MTRVVIDATMKSKLHNLTEPLVLCDESGNVLGTVIPSVDLSEYEPCGPQVSDEELERRANSHERRYTTAEVLAHLEKL